MTELPYQPIPYVAGFINPDGRDRDAAAHELVLELSRLLGPGPTDRVVIESYFEPMTDGWRMVAHRVPARPGTPETPEETRARVTLALEAALNSEEGRAIAASILERKQVVAELDARSAPRPDDWEAEVGLLGSDVSVRVEEPAAAVRHWTEGGARGLMDPERGQIRVSLRHADGTPKTADEIRAEAARIVDEEAGLSPAYDSDVEDALDRQIHEDLAEGRQ